VEGNVQARDRYRRLLAYVWLTDGRMLNVEIMREGYARVC
jgi:micrococcal nuclease